MPGVNCPHLAAKPCRETIIKSYTYTTKGFSSIVNYLHTMQLTLSIVALLVLTALWLYDKPLKSKNKRNTTNSE